MSTWSQGSQVPGAPALYSRLASSPRSVPSARRWAEPGAAAWPQPQGKEGTGCVGSQVGVWILTPALSNAGTLGWSHCLSEPQVTCQMEVTVIFAPCAMVRDEEGDVWHRA